MSKSLAEMEAAHLLMAAMERARELGEPAPEHFPGKDFPDREEWLRIREERNERRKHEKLIYGGKKPLMLGINRAKTLLDANKRADNSKHPAKRGARGDLIEQRHAYYTRKDK